MLAFLGKTKFRKRNRSKKKNDEFVEKFRTWRNFQEKNNRIDQLEKDLTRQLGQKLDLDEQISHSAVQRSENVEQIENEIDELRRLMTKIDQVDVLFC